MIRRGLAACVVALLAALAGWAGAQEVQWRHLSSKTRDLPTPGESQQQTGAVVGDLDKDGINDFILSFRQKAPALVAYRRTQTGWDRYVIEKEFLTVEAGGAIFDVDNDGWPDVVFGGDWQSNQVWWWKNPGKEWKPDVAWKRYTIKKSGATQQHDQIFGDFKGTGRPQLVYWNQGAKKLFIAEIPAHPAEVAEWPATEVFSGTAGENPGKYAEGLAAADIDGDGRVDLLAGNYWFKYEGNNTFKPIRVGTIGGRIAAGRLIRDAKFPQVVIAPGDGVGALRWYECKGQPEDAGAWVGHDLIRREMVHGHTLQVADVDGDGNLDVFAAEMAKWSENRPDADNPNAEAWIFYGDGKGGFRQTVLAKGMGFHEGRVADLDGDGLMDVLDKPYTWEAPRVDVFLQVRRSAGLGKAGVGLELYSLRTEATRSLPGMLDTVQQMGFVDVELPGLYNLSAAKVRELLDKRGLVASSAIFPYERYAQDLDGIVKDAKALGIEYVCVAWIPHNGAFTEADAARASGDFNAWGEKLAQQGLRFCYHPHGYEFAPVGEGTLFDRMVRATNPKFVNYELDVFWAFHGGQDPVKLMQKYPDRFPLVHLKDMTKGTKTGLFTGSAPEETSAVLGAGQIDIAAIMAEGKKIGVKHYFIEDEHPKAAEQIPQSLKFLADHK